MAVTRSRNAFSSEELVDFKNKAAMAYAPRNVWDQEEWKDIFLFLEQFALENLNNVCSSGPPQLHTSVAFINTVF